jgi:hypothetical protein
MDPPIITAKNQPSPRRVLRQESPRRYVRKSFPVEEEDFVYRDPRETREPREPRAYPLSENNFTHVQKYDLIVDDKTVDRIMGPDPIPTIDIEYNEI